jgi:hypothetical protein
MGAEFAGTAFSMSAISSKAPNELWYLVWGKMIGDTGARVKIRLYGFDGQQVRTIWQRDDLRGGSLTVSPDEIKLDHFESPNEGSSAAPRHLRETLRPGQTGLENFRTEYLE